MNHYFIIAGVLSFIAALLHLLIIYKGTAWYEYFHAGDRMVKLSKQGSLIPATVTFIITAVLFIWALYAFSGSQIIGRLPLLEPVLILITSIYLFRGVAIIPLYLFYPEKSDPFLIWSSCICFMIGLFYFIGIYTM